MPTDPLNDQDDLAAVKARLRVWREDNGCWCGVCESHVADILTLLDAYDALAVENVRLAAAVGLLRELTDETLAECDAYPGHESRCQCEPHVAVRVIGERVAAFLTPPGATTEAGQ